MNKRISGVNPNLYEDYRFEDHNWYNNLAMYKNLYHLANSASKVGTDYWMKIVGTGKWTKVGTKTEGKLEARNKWLGAILPTGDTVDSDMIEEFFEGTKFVSAMQGGKPVFAKVEGPSVPRVEGVMSVPGGGQFVKYKGLPYLNNWYDAIIDGDAQYLQQGKAVLLMCYASLCSAPLLSDDLAAESERIYNMVVSNNYDNFEFSFLMNWLAAIYQRPGINLQTNLWLIGKTQGVGKGTIIDIMRTILGSEFVGMLSQTDIERGWNDHLLGKQLIEINEFETSSKHGWSGKEWGRWIKSNTIEPQLMIMGRNKTPYPVLNIGNYIGASNSIEQTFIDAEDRRNQFIKTTEDLNWVQYAANIQLSLFKKNPLHVAAGFAEILSQVKVNMELLGKSHKTAFRNEIAEMSNSAVDDWIENDPTINHDLYVQANIHYKAFCDWYRTVDPSGKIPSQTLFGIQLRNTRLRQVTRKRTGSGNLILIEHKPVVISDTFEQGTEKLKEVVPNAEGAVVFDADVELVEIDPSNLTPMQKMRLQLAKLTEE